MQKQDMTKELKWLEDRISLLDTIYDEQDDKQVLQVVNQQIKIFTNIVVFIKNNINQKNQKSCEEEDLENQVLKEE